MPIYYEDTLENLSAIHAGIRVVSATASLTNVLANSNIFNIENGRVLLIDFYGENMAVVVAGVVTVAIHAIPDTGTTSIIATATAVTGMTTGMKCFLPAFGGALGVTTSGYAPLKTQPVYLLRPGVLNAVASAVDAGTFRWFAFYVPVDVGAYMSAA